MAGRDRSTASGARRVATSVSLLAIVLLAGPAAAAGDGDVRSAALATYIHGMTAEIAEAEVGPEGVPALLRLLADPEFPRRDNVVAFLAFLGDDEAAGRIERLLESPPARLTSPEEERAFLLAPQSLGQIAARGSARALRTLLEITDAGSGNDLLTRAASHADDPERMRADLLRMAFRGLAYAGHGEAEQRLLAIARGEIGPGVGPADVRGEARSALDLGAELRGLAPHPSSPTERSEASTVTAGTLDPATHVHDAGLTYANHVEVADPMDDARLDRVLGIASLRAGRGDDPDDVACCVTVSRSGSTKTFGASADGLDSIDDAAERNAVLDDRTARVKVVRAIHYCSGPGTNIIGCAWQPGWGVAVVRMGSEASEAVLWLHEYGHNTGLSHSTRGTRYIMHGTDYGTNDLVDQAECDTFHTPHAWSETVPTEVAACADADGDLVHDVVDNCPGDHNPDQVDANGDGSGDVCDGGGSPCGNGVIDPGEDCDGGNLAGESCASFGYRSGVLACDTTCSFDRSGCSCMDLDGDHWGDPGAPAGACAIDCDDADGSVWNLPGEVRQLTFADGDGAIEWTAPVDPGATELRFDVLRSGDPGDFGTGAVCVESDGADLRAMDPENPGSGGVFFYLARAENACPGGAGSVGPGRVSRDCGS